MAGSNSDFQLRERLMEEFGQEQSEQILDLFCSGVCLELTKLKESTTAENQPRLLHNSRGLRAVCQSVFVSDMEQTCLEIEAACERLDWPMVDRLVLRLQEQFDNVCQQYK
jgi:HPt (histidine-containing phosphotransfer) domain-containing protein